MPANLAPQYLDAACAVPRAFVHSLKFSKGWRSEKSGRSVKCDGQPAERTRLLEDGDILELHL
jgi:ribosome-interacting GTPase 1